MQEEVDQKTIALSMKTGKLTAQVLQAALKKYLQHRAKGKTTLHHGQQSLKQLKKHGAALSNIEITEANIGAFKPCAKKYGVDFALILLRAKFQLVANPFSIFGFLPHDFWIKVVFHGQAANLDKLYHDGQAGNCPLILDIGKIPGFDIYLFRQVFSCEMLCFPRFLYVCAESFKTGAIFDFCHIASPTYILYFIVCSWNVAICGLVELYISYFLC